MTDHPLPPGICRDDTVHGVRYHTDEEVRAYAEAAVARERERCATLCETNELLSGGNGPNFAFGWGTAIKNCADAIRKGP